jgi:RimJ/RimL family protein N-acetyltransferase
VVCPACAGHAAGWLCLCNIFARDAAIEIGSIWLSPKLQRTRAATEAIYLLMRHVFDDLGHLRFVWRCASLNDASRQAAECYGFTFEGILRSSAVVKGWQRDQAWFSMLASEWPARKSAIAAWLDETKFDEAGGAILKLAR